ncbi:hypothetical protein AB0942_15260 [Streptomyces nodosus]|uniref:hypothetical protein n=1 Tax=Streptomyces nodosus TaxID=40318 RepID=UPI0034572A90
MLAALGEATLATIAKVQARVRRHVWSLLPLRAGGFPWLVVAGKRLCGWIVIDVDAADLGRTSRLRNSNTPSHNVATQMSPLRGVVSVQPSWTRPASPDPSESGPVSCGEMNRPPSEALFTPTCVLCATCT